MSEVLDAQLAEIKRVFHEEPKVRITLGLALSLSQGTVKTAVLEIQQPHNGRWVQVKPMLVPPEGGAWPELLDLLAGIAREGDS